MVSSNESMCKVERLVVLDHYGKIRAREEEASFSKGLVYFVISCFVEYSKGSTILSEFFFPFFLCHCVLMQLYLS